MKKVFALFLSLVLCWSVFAIPSFAADEATPVQEFVAGAQEALHQNTEGFSAADKLAVDLLQDVTSYAENVTVATADDDASLTDLLLEVYEQAGATALELPVVPSGPANAPRRVEGTATEEGSGNPITGGKYSVGELSRLIRKYMFIKIDDPDQVAALIAETTEFSYAVINGGDGTVYIRVNVEENPQIFNYDVFRALVVQLYEKQNEEIKTDAFGKIDYLMSYEHIAGELALHTIVFAATNSIIDVTGTRNEKILDLYRSAAEAALNIDEDRVPTEFIRFIGNLIVNVFKFNVLKLFSFLA